jgi:dTDP-4-dehydrorhamnose 3,5-epimerase-like enzyme
VFVEMLKTPDSGQFSYFTAHPGITRGGHYHHTKTEKFLVIKGHACFRFRHIASGEFYELYTDGDTPRIVETVPGWTHDITNVGETEMIVMLWATPWLLVPKPEGIRNEYCAEKTENRHSGRNAPGDYPFVTGHGGAG